MKRPDVLVIGGGFAGLSAAIHLAAGGAEVHLVDQNESLGGKAGELRVDGFRFDTGPSVFTLPEVFEEVFAAAGRSSPLELEPLDLLCRYRFPSGRVWDVYRDVERTIAPLSPTEADAYVGLLAEARRLYEGAAPTFVFGAPPTWWDLATYAIRHGARAHPLRSLESLLDAYGAVGDLKTFFLRFATYFGADPYRAPAVLHNIAWVELGLGVAYPEHGIHGAVRALEELARELGVTISTGTRVRRFAAGGGRIRAIETDRGTFEPRHVVSTMDRARTLAALSRSVPVDAATSLSGFVVLLGVEGHQPRLAHHTIDFPEDYAAEFAALERGELPPDPTLYFHVSSRLDASDAPPGAENWFVMANAPALPPSAGGAPAAGSVATDPDRVDARRREAAYAEAIEARLIRTGYLDGMCVGVRRWLGPSDLERHGHRGAIYGRAPHSLLATLRPTQGLAGIDNLTLAGGTVYPGGGIPLALLSGREASVRALRELARSR